MSSELKKVTITNRKEFLALKAYLVNKNLPFMYTSQGSIDSVIYNGREFISVDLRESGGKGHHLNRRFRKDIDEWIARNGDTMPHYDGNFREQLFNIHAIEKAIGKPRVAIDINDCYWRTSYKLGYITEPTYLIGLKKKEWKEGRNACIGSLLKVKRFTPYVPSANGKSMADHKARPAPLRNPIEYEYIRNHIIGYVYEIFYRLSQELGDHFYMFLTDCVFTDYESKDKAEKYFSSFGYKTKSKPVEFTALDKTQKMIFWHDFEDAKKSASEDKMKGDKYMYYATRMLIDGTKTSDIKLK